MRGVAAFAVVLFHASGVLGVKIMPHGYLAVDLFFVLSGYVIAKNYDGRMAAGLSAGRFAAIRALRFYPLYLLGILAGCVKELALLVAHNEHAFSPAILGVAVLAGALFIPFPYRDTNMFPLNIPSWSLFFELLVNVAYCATFGLWSRRNLLILTSIAGAWLTVSIVMEGSADVGPHIAQLLSGSVRTIFSFGVGILLARQPLSLPAIPTPFLLIAIAALMAVQAMGAWYDIFFILLVSPALVALGTKAIENDRAVPAYAYLGAISFPIYAIHRPLLHIAESAATIAHLPAPLLGGACIIGLLIICPFLTSLYDKPATRWLAQRLTGGKPASPAAEART
jgi:peptidoglycan/LPS O-acetylase OafA/YrhL